MAKNTVALAAGGWDFLAAVSPKKPKLGAIAIVEKREKGGKWVRVLQVPLMFPSGAPYQLRAVAWLEGAGWIRARVLPPSAGSVGTPTAVQIKS